MNDAAQGCIPHQLIDCSECRKDNLIRTQRNEIERLRAFKVRAEEELRSACGDDFERVWRYVDGGIAS